MCSRLWAPWKGDAGVAGRRGGYARMRRHKGRAIRPASAWDFGVDAGATFLIVALGKRSPMPYVWLPRGGAGLVPERQGAFGALRCSAKWWKCLTRRNSSVRAHSSVGRAADS
jgi:hypothetical protein